MEAAVTPDAVTPDAVTPVVRVGDGRRDSFVVLRHHDGEQDWLVAFRFAAVDDRLGERRPVEFAVRQADEAALSGMTSKTIRALPIGELLAAARRALSADRGATPGESKLRIVTPSAVRLPPFLEDARGRQPRDDKAYAGLAFEYALLVRDGDRTPAKTLADRHGGASGTWANRIAEARKRGLLTAVKSGEAGGGLSDKAIELVHPGWSSEDDARIDAEITEEE
ncbi:hypothetical protein HH310_30985 [Actinoplanes sp. TBRC 11911]|uniref:hypothetical protein n=1 Tax=Actinoplanes sp. TBRC 11911 TaxID=2729386 RepID=UPI00145D403C|nr:hypothetical protein [Actinoplanes sp. TBRC 11911]NMO55598.1 hypothetical protein [Actinoplanes sp. TBRC 11911]